ncbi:MAG: hypothetical protein ACE15D_16380 [Candidatus Eisenbacteria bacterium]
MGESLSIRAYAEHRRGKGLPGHTPWAVQKALKSGRIHKNAQGKIDAQEADAEWEKRTSPARRAAMAAGQKAQTLPTELSGGPSYAQARAVRELYAARLARLEFEEKSASLVSADQVKVEIFRKARQVRDRMMAIPRRNAARLAAETDARVIERILSEEVRKALEVLGHE